MVFSLGDEFALSMFHDNTHSLDTGMFSCRASGTVYKPLRSGASIATSTSNL